MTLKVAGRRFPETSPRTGGWREKIIIVKKRPTRELKLDS